MAPANAALGHVTTICSLSFVPPQERGASSGSASWSERRIGMHIARVHSSSASASGTCSTRTEGATRQHVGAFKLLHAIIECNTALRSDAFPEPRGERSAARPVLDSATKKSPSPGVRVAEMSNARTLVRRGSPSSRFVSICGSISSIGYARRALKGFILGAAYDGVLFVPKCIFNAFTH